MVHRPTIDLPWNPQYSQRQAEALAALAAPDVREVLYGGARGGGKSGFGCIWSVRQAFSIIGAYGLGPTRHPVPLGFLGRQVGTDFNDTTLEIFKRVIPANLYEIRTQDKEIVLAGKAAKLCYGGLDSETARHKALGAEYAFVFLDQAEELSEDDIADLRGALRLTIGGKRVPSKLLLTANPCQGWLKDQFFVAPTPERRFVQALPSDNPWLPADYTQTLTRAYQHRPELLAAYLHGSWDAFEGSNQIIKGEWVRKAGERRLFHDKPLRLIVCDPARFGDNETVIYDLDDTEIADAEIYGQKDTMYTANRLAARSRARGNCLVVVDECGIGGPVVDRLVELGVEVLAVNSAEQASEPDRFVNLRAEMWDNAARMFCDGDVALHWSDRTLAAQLCIPTYQYRGGKLQIEKKEDIAERMSGRSPDRADAYVMGLWGLCYARRSLKSAGRAAASLRRPLPVERMAAPEGSYAARERERLEAELARSRW